MTEQLEIVFLIVYIRCFIVCYLFTYLGSKGNSEQMKMEKRVKL